MALNIKDSFAMLLVLMIWVLYFAAIGNYMFREQFEGYSQFDSFSSSYWAMFVCLTTENFPDVMLLAQEVNSAYTIFFVVFILIGCFYLMSVLLAVIFDNFKKRMEILQRKKVSYRMEYIEQFFNAFDEQDDGWLSIKDTRAFFATVCDLDYKKKNHRKLFVKIMRIVDPENNCVVFKERILEFFRISGFSIIKELCQE